jgi:hypothetical protein
LRNRTLRYLASAFPLLIALLALCLPGGAGAAETGSIAGSISAGGFGIGGIEVCAFGYEGAPTAGTSFCEEDVSSGYYAIHNVPPGEYLVHFEPGSQNYVAQWWHDQTEYFSASSVTVTPGGVVAGIGAELVAGATLSGTVTAAAGGSPIAGVYVCAYEEGALAERCASTDAAGHYTVPGLFEGTWEVAFFPYGSGQNLLYQDYPSPIAVHTKTPVAGINAALGAGGQISGTVRSAATGAPLGGVRVCLSRAEKEVDTYECKKTGTSGSYLFFGIQAGSWKVAFSPETSELLQADPYAGEADEFAEAPDAYPTQWWNGKPTFAAADSIAITPPAIVTGIDGTLGPPPAPTSSSSSSSAAPIASPSPAAKKLPLICHKGFAKRKVRGKQRCVRRHKKHHHRRHHKKHRAQP